MIEANIYRALGDPIRLEIVKRLATGSPNTVGELSKNLGISRQGARKQLQVLVNAKVVHLTQRGRQTNVTLDTGSGAPVVGAASAGFPDNLVTLGYAGRRLA